MSRREYALIGESLWLDRANQARLCALARGEIDWSLVVETAGRSAVLPTLARTLLHAPGVAPCIDAAARDELSDSMAQHAMQNRLLLRDLEEVVTALGARKVPSIALKGAALLAAGHVPLEARHTDDIDLLIREEDRVAALAVVTALGYTERKVESGGAPRLDHHGSLWVPAPSAGLGSEWGAHHHLEIYDSPSGTPLELHRAPPGGAALRHLDFAARLGRASRVTLGNGEVFVPSPADLFETACVHVMVDHGAAPPYLARHLVDLSALIARVPGSVLRELCLAPQTRAAVGWSLVLYALASARFPPVHSVLFSARVASAYERRLYYRHILAQVEHLRGQGPRELLKRLFPSRTYMAQTFRLPPDSPWIPPLYVLRMLRIPLLPFFEKLERRA